MVNQAKSMAIKKELEENRQNSRLNEWPVVYESCGIVSDNRLHAFSMGCLRAILGTK